MKAASRRIFFTRAIWVLGGLISAGLGATAGVYLLAPGRKRQDSEWIAVADPGALEIRRPEEVVFRRNRVDGWKVSSEKSTAWVVRLSENDIVALAPTCTHLGCAYRYDESRNEFACPCHTSNFSLDGKVLSGPAPRPLDRYPVKVENGKVLLGIQA